MSHPPAPKPFVDLQAASDAFSKAINDLTAHGKALQYKSQQFDTHLNETRNRFEIQMKKWDDHIEITFKDLYNKQQALKDLVEKEMGQTIEATLKILKKRQQTEFLTFSQNTMASWQKQMSENAESFRSDAMPRFHKLIQQSELDLNHQLQMIHDRVLHQKKILETRLNEQETLLNDGLENIKKYSDNQIAEFKKITNATLQDQKNYVLKLVTESKHYITDQMDVLTKELKNQNAEWIEASRKRINELITQASDHHLELVELEKDYKQKLETQITIAQVRTDEFLADTTPKISRLLQKMEDLDGKISAMGKVVGSMVQQAGDEETEEILSAFRDWWNHRQRTAANAASPKNIQN